MHRIKFLYPKSSFSRLISKNLENIPLDLNLVYRFNQKVNGVSILYSHKKDGYWFNDTLRNFQCSTKLITSYNNDNFVISEKLKVQSDDTLELTNEYSLRISNLSNGEMVCFDDFNYNYYITTKLIQNDLFKEHSDITKNLLKHIEKEIFRF
jgi:hypothetical protein